MIFRSFVFITILLLMNSCGGEVNYNTNPDEVAFRLNSVVLTLPKDFKKIEDFEAIKFADKQLTEVMKLRETDFTTFFIKEKDGEVVSLIQLATRGRRVEINGENFDQFLSIVKSINSQYTQSGMNSVLVEENLEHQGTPKYFKVKTKITGLEGEEWMMSHYLMSNEVRTAQVSVFNLNADDDDLEKFMKRTMLF